MRIHRPSFVMPSHIQTWTVDNLHNADRDRAITYCGPLWQVITANDNRNDAPIVVLSSVNAGLLAGLEMGLHSVILY